VYLYAALDVWRSNETGPMAALAFVLGVLPGMHAGALVFLEPPPVRD
jgi:hypothetical protein